MFNLDKKKLSLTVAFLVVFALGIFIGAKTSYYYVPKPDNIDFSLFWDAYNKLQENFVDHSKINDQNIVYGAIAGMAKSLGDPYTSFFNPDESKIFQESLSGSFEGIGAEVGIKKDQLIIIAPLEGMPASKAGLKPGDAILKIDGKDTSDMAIETAVNLIRGQKGTSVTLTIFREGWDHSRDIKINRDTIKPVIIQWSMKEGNVAYVQIFQFDMILSNDFKKIAKEITDQKAQRIVLDLRGNPGGYLDVAQDIAGWFLKKGSTVTIEDFGSSNKPQQIYTSEGSGQFTNYPVVVLINEGSASASEILAGALRDNRNVKLVGAKSFGKGSVQTIVNLRGGSILKITIAKWLTPKGNSISEVGLTPDVKIETTEDDAKNNKDPQLDKALEIIKTLK